MTFLRGAWRILVGIKDALVLVLLLLFFGLIYAALSHRPASARIHEGALLLKLDGTVVEQPSPVKPFNALGQGDTPREYARGDIVRALTAAADDAKVKAVVLDLDGFLGGGQVALSDIGAALDRMRARGKPVLAYASAYANDGYQLAAHASEVWMDPLGGALLAGPGGANLYFKNALDKLGVDAHIYRVGTYKSAVEPFLRSDQSPEAAEASRALYGELWQDWQAEVHRARPKANLAPLIEQPVAAVQAAQGDLSKRALADHLVDRLGGRNDFASRVAQIAGDAADPGPGRFAAISLKDYVKANPVKKSGGAVGVVTIAGEIVDGKADPGRAGGDTVAKLINDGLRNEDLKALVVRVDSPGGSVLASEQIRRAILTAKAKGLPIVVSMGNLAASGGYWVSTPADVIFAEPATITGSIGIFGIVPSFEKALAKLGVNADGVKTTPLSGEPNVFGGIDPAFDKVAQSVIEKGYRDFVGRVSQARHLSPQRVDEIGQGRVWAGGTAHQLGLVDRFGSLDDAVREAARRARLDRFHPLALEPERSWAESLFSDIASDEEDDPTINSSLDLFGRARVQQELLLTRAVATVAMLGEARGAQVRCLECAAFDTSANLPRPPVSLWQLIRARFWG